MDPTPETVFSRYKGLIEPFDTFMAAMRTPQPTCVWANTMRIDRDTLQKRLEDRGLEVTPSPWHPWALRLPTDFRPGTTLAYALGLYHVQEEVAMAAITALDPQPGERVLDLCSAPGNKTVLTAVTMQNTGTIVANDVKTGRLSSLRYNLERLGILNTAVTQYNGSGFPREAGLFDRVLADVPCSCEGTGRKSKGAWKNIPPHVRLKITRTQSQILLRGLALTRPGGTLVYATCTFAPEENEGVITDILQGRGKVVPFEAPGLQGRPGLSEWQGTTYRPDLTHARRFYPHELDSGGFFVARIEVTS